MIPVLQTILADPARNDGHDAEGCPGNCYQAAIASALGLPLAEVPHFATFTDDWCEQSAAWFGARGIVRYFYDPAAVSWPLWVERRTRFDADTVVDDVVAVLGAGPSPRGAFRHCVVLDPATGLMAHDPHPSGAGLVEVDELEVLFEVTA